MTERHIRSRVAWVALVGVAVVVFVFTDTPPALAACDVVSYHQAAEAVATGQMAQDLDAHHSDMSSRGIFNSGIHYGGDRDIAESYGWIWDESSCWFIPPTGPGSTGTIKGVVRYKGSPLAGVEVFLGAGIPRYKCTDQAGRFEFINVWTGVTSVSATGVGDPNRCSNNAFLSPTGDALKVQWWDHVDSVNDATLFSVGPNEVKQITFDVTRVNSGVFLDDDHSIFENSIEWLAVEGITQGCNPPANTMFCPDDFVTRGEMAVFLVRALDYTDNGGGNLFTDDDGFFYENSADRLKTAKVTLGCNPPTNDKYCGESHVTRGQMAAFLVRAMGYTDNGGGNLFTDDDGHLFENAIDKLGAAKVTLGCNPPDNTKFCPDDFVTRGQMAAFLKRALG